MKSAAVRILPPHPLLLLLGGLLGEGGPASSLCKFHELTHSENDVQDCQRTVAIIATNVLHTFSLAPSSSPRPAIWVSTWLTSSRSSYFCREWCELYSRHVVGLSEVSDSHAQSFSISAALSTMEDFASRCLWFTASAGFHLIAFMIIVSTCVLLRDLLPKIF